MCAGLAVKLVTYFKKPHSGEMVPVQKIQEASPRHKSGWHPIAPLPSWGSHMLEQCGTLQIVIH